MKEIVFDKVDKSYYLQHQKTIKELVQAVFQGEKTRELIHALERVSFEVEKGETVGIIGRNGAGKSTILKLMAGVTRPTSGSLTISGKLAPLIELGAGFHPELTGSENIYLNGVILGLTEAQVAKKFNEICEFSELEPRFIDMPVKHYSSGMYMRLAFSIAISTNPEILLIDEILAVGDTAFQKKCFSKMNEFKKKKVTIIYISHNMAQVKEFCSRVIYLKSGSVAYDGPSSHGVMQYLNDVQN